MLVENTFPQYPVCPHFEECGGCKIQNLSYQHQLINKQDVVFNLFKEFDGDSSIFFPIIASPLEWKYRNKMEFSFSNSKQGERFLGLFSKKWRRKILNLKECHLCPDWFLQVSEAVRQWWAFQDIQAYHCYSNQGSLRHVTLREGKNTGDKMVVMTISGDPAFQWSSQQKESFKEKILEVCEGATILLRKQHIAKKKPTWFEEEILEGRGFIFETLRLGRDYYFKINSSAFFQPNTLQAEQLYKRAFDLAKFSRSDVIYDLYCGTGTLGLLISNDVHKVIGIELNADAAYNAQENCLLNHIENVRIIQGDVGEQLAFLNEKPDGVILDPPRSGLMPIAIQHLIQLKPKKILYISCNPKTQYENVKNLLSEGYVLKAIQPVDQFPHTEHIENIVLLEAR